MNDLNKNEEPNHLLGHLPGVKVYLVGGAVRDRLLGRSAKDLDYVVTNVTPADMEKAGYRQVGASFPVFLHPVTGSEYALARTERKTGKGYNGFHVEFRPGITIEEDLMRRDLTINAMAIDTESGSVIDPFGGQADIKKGILRHVSSSFSEDPLRVLRVARLASQLPSFSVAKETKDLMREIANSGELKHLKKERIFNEMRASLLTSKPSLFFLILEETGALAEVFPQIANLRGVDQNLKHHPEGCVLTHTMMVLDAAAGLSNSLAVRFSALVHDLGKGVTEKALLPAHHGHEEAGVSLVELFCEEFRVPSDWRQLSLQVTAEHLNFHRSSSLSAGRVLKILKKVRTRERLEDFVMACSADAIGRGVAGDSVQMNSRVAAEKSCQVFYTAYDSIKSLDLSEILSKHSGSKHLPMIIEAEQIKAIKAALKLD